MPLSDSCQPRPTDPDTRLGQLRGATSLPVRGPEGRNGCYRLLIVVVVVVLGLATMVDADPKNFGS